MLNHKIFPSEKKTDKHIILLHGLGGNHRVWKHQIPLLQKWFNVLTIDLPSHSENNKLLSMMEVTIDAVSKEIIKILNFLKIKSGIFMGVSIGTIFIKHLEMQYPQYVDNAILVGAIGRINWIEKTIIKAFSKIGDKLPFKMVYGLFSKIIMPAKGSKKSRKIFCECAKVLTAKEFKNWMEIFAEAIKMNLQFKKEQHQDNLYISGDKDICFLKGIREEVVETDAQYIEMKKCGHVCNIDQKEVFNDIILNMFRAQYNVA